MDAVGALAGIGVKVGLAAALAVCASAALRRLREPRLRGRARGRLRVLETRPLGPQQALHLIAVGDRTLLLASAANAVALIAEMPGEHPAPELEGAPAQPDFASTLAPLLGDRGAAEPDLVGRLRQAADALRNGGRA